MNRKEIMTKYYQKHFEKINNTELRQNNIIIKIQKIILI